MAREFLTPLVLLAFLTVFAPPLQAQGGGDNVLFLVADDLGVDQLACYGEGTTTAPTPTVDSLAAGGVLFRNAWAHPLCSPTRASFHTGRHPFRTGVGTVIGGAGSAVLQPVETTLPELLGGTSYANALIGKWHLGTTGIGGNSAPNVAGWSHFAGALQGAIPSYYSWSRVVNGVAATSTRYATSQNVDDALAWIAAQNGPWLCAVTFNAPHTPYQAPPANLHTQNLVGLDPTTNPRPFYRAMVEAMDTEIARLLAGLGAARSRTNIVFLGDNGTPSAIVQAPFVRTHAKASPYEGGINVPLIVSGPIVASPGRESAALVESVDLFATLASLCGVDAASAVPAGTILDARSFAGLLSDPSAMAPRTTAFSEQFSGSSEDACVRDAQHKLIRRRSGGTEDVELYDLVADPFESRDLMSVARTAAQQRAFEDLHAVLARARDEGLALRFGSACGGIALAADADGPTLGALFLVEITSLGASANAASLLLGLSRDSAAGTSLPIPLDPIGMTGCSLLVSIEDAAAAAITAGRAALTLAVPADVALSGATLFVQGIVLQPGANAAGVIASDAMTLVVGS